jgi:hypothetical protein
LAGSTLGAAVASVAVDHDLLPGDGRVCPAITVFLDRVFPAGDARIFDG